MLHQEASEPATLALIRQLQADPVLDGFLLAGGTALALMIGHRISIDIDLFTRKPFDAEALNEHLEKRYGFSLQFMHKNTLKGFINWVFVDILTHDYPLLVSPLNTDNIVMISKEDIAAMKVNAITGNGTRAKDFVDIYFLLKEFSFKEILDFYSQKYRQRNSFHAVKSLTYFDDIDATAWPNLIREKQLKLKDVRKEIIRNRDLFLNAEH